MMKLGQKEKTDIDGLVAQVEAKTGVQILAAAAGKSDTYPEIPWKAFSLGTALAILASTLFAILRPASASLFPIFGAVVVLSTGLTFALAAVFLQPVSRLFLGDARAHAETKQFALSFFFERGLGRTRSRNAILVLVSQFERRAALVADSGIAARIAQSELDGVSSIIDAALARGCASAALSEGLTALEELLRIKGFNAPHAAGDEIPEEFLETEGPRQ